MQGPRGNRQEYPSDRASEVSADQGHGSDRMPWDGSGVPSEEDAHWPPPEVEIPWVGGAPPELRAVWICGVPVAEGAPPELQAHEFCEVESAS